MPGVGLRTRALRLSIVAHEACTHHPAICHLPPLLPPTSRSPPRVRLCVDRRVSGRTDWIAEAQYVPAANREGRSFEEGACPFAKQPQRTPAAHGAVGIAKAKGTVCSLGDPQSKAEGGYAQCG